MHHRSHCFLVDGGATTSLWPQHKASPRDHSVKVKLTGAGGHQIPTFGTRHQEMEFSGQLFNHTFINATIKMAFLGRDFYEANDLVENYRCSTPRRRRPRRSLPQCKQVFSQLDLVKGYFQVPVHKDNQAKTTVVTPFGTFQFYAIQS